MGLHLGSTSPRSSHFSSQFQDLMDPGSRVITIYPLGEQFLSYGRIPSPRPSSCDFLPYTFFPKSQNQARRKELPGPGINNINQTGVHQTGIPSWDHRPSPPGVLPQALGRVKSQSLPLHSPQADWREG